MSRNCEIIKSLNDTRNYRYVRLDNGLRALLISDLNLTDKAINGKTAKVDENTANEKLSAAALSIGVGSFYDPPDIPGFAHFLEHMVFMGSEKYPDENEFDSYTSTHGGSTNAYTDNEEIVFYFDITKDYFYEGLDRFAQFFIKPLMKKDAIDRELQAVDSEYEMSTTSDDAKKGQLLASLAHDGHPMGKFTMGNSETLKKIPMLNNINVYERLQDFHMKAYSSDYMTLAVISKHTLDDLEKNVLEIFKAVPCNNISKPEFTHFPLPFDYKKFHKFYQVIPVKNKHCLEINWQLPPLLHTYKEKPLSYLDFIIGHEGEGTIMSYLKKKFWALEIEAGTSYSGSDFNSIYSLFSIVIELTPLGLEHISEVLSVVFQFLDKMREEPPSNRIFNEMKNIEDNVFRWREQEDPYEYVEKVCHWMQMFPIEHTLTGNYLFYDFDPNLISSLMDQLVPDKAHFILSSHKDSDKCDLTERWYKTKYMVKDVPDEWKLTWNNLTSNEYLCLPKENEFISSDFTIKLSGSEISQYPYLLKENQNGKIWYKKDNKFKVPKAYYQILFKSDIPRSNACNATCFDVFIDILKENLNEVAYAANAAQLEYSIEATDSGLAIKVSGFNDKLPQLLNVIIDHISDFKVSTELFETIKDKTKRYYANKAIQPEYLCRELRFSILRQPYWSVVDRQNCLLSLTYDQFLSFSKVFCAKLYVESLYQGNITCDEIMLIDEMVRSKLQYEALPVNRHPISRVTKLESEQSYCRVKNFNDDDKNSVITNYYQHGIATVENCTFTDLMMLYMQEPCFDILRTKKQLGYGVYCSSRYFDNIIGCSITVCSQANKFNMEELHNHMREFVETFKNMSIEMKDEEFEKLVKSLITLKTCEDTCLEEEVNRNWDEVITDRYLFDRLQKEVDILKCITLEQFRNWIATYFNTMLSCQVVGNPIEICDDVEMKDDGETSDSEESDDDEDEDEDEDEEEINKMDFDETFSEKTSRLEFVSVDNDIANLFISDISKFTNNLYLYPNSKLDESSANNTTH